MFQRHRQRRTVPGENKSNEKEKVEVWRRAKPPAKTPRLTDVLIQKTVKTIEALSSALHANPHVSIRDSLSRGEDVPRRPTGFKHLFCLRPPGSVCPKLRGGHLALFLLRNDASRNSLCKHLPPIVQIRDNDLIIYLVP